MTKTKKKKIGATRFMRLKNMKNVLLFNTNKKRISESRQLCVCSIEET